MPLPSSRLQVPSRAPPFSPIRDRERAGSVRDRLGERERIHGPHNDRSLHSGDGRGRGDWTKERDRGDRDWEGQRERGDGGRNSEKEMGREQARETEKERGRRALVWVREADREPVKFTSSARMEDGELDSRDSRGPARYSARQGAMDSGKGTSPQKKRKCSPIVWDLDDTKRGTQASTSQAAPHISTRM